MGSAAGAWSPCPRRERLSALGNMPTKPILPDEAKDLPPPNLVNHNSVWMAFMGWSTAVLGNAINARPVLKTGVHRQLLLASIGWFLGYHGTRQENYFYAKRDQEVNFYVKTH